MAVAAVMLLDIQPAQGVKAGVVGVVKRGGLPPGGHQLFGLFHQGRVLGVFPHNLIGHAVPVALPTVKNGVAQVLPQHPVLHQQLCQVQPRAGYVVVAAALPQVDFKHLVLPVPAVVLDVEVRKAGVANLLQEMGQLLHQLLVVLGEDGRMVAYGLRGVLLQHHVAQAHHFYLPVLVAVGGQHPHLAVSPGNKVLHNQALRVAGGIDALADADGLGGAAGKIHLFHAGEGELPVVDAGGGL